MALDVKIEVKIIKDVVILNITHWKKETSLLTVKIARSQGDLSYVKRAKSFLTRVLVCLLKQG